MAFMLGIKVKGNKTICQIDGRGSQARERSFLPVFFSINMGWKDMMEKVF
jgi:hypothetical protein